MNDIKSIVAKNIAELRQMSGMTQIDLAERLNYTDKAVSKWERGESLPDVTVLCQIADLFQVSLDFLVREEHSRTEIRQEMAPVFTYNRGIITWVSILTVWFSAIFSFVILALTPEPMPYKWLCFIYAIPASAVVWLIMNSLWFNRRFNYFIISGLVWSSLLCFHLSFLVAGHNFWQLYLIGIPAQVIILFWTRLKNRKEKKK